MGMGGGAVLFFADDGDDGLAGGGEFDRGRFFDVFALGDGVFGSAAAFLDALVLPLLLPENEVLLRLHFGRGLVGRLLIRPGSALKVHNTNT